MNINFKGSMDEIQITGNTKNDADAAKVKRVQTEFLRQIYGGKNEKDAFMESLKAIDEKYQPKSDVYITLGNIRSVKTESINKWFDIISDAIPVMENIFSLLTNVKKGSENKPE